MSGLLSRTRKESKKDELVGEALDTTEGKKVEEGDSLKDVLDVGKDPKNPQFVPRNGRFYEHDDRGGGKIKVSHKKDHIKPKKDAVKDESGKWSHDKYNQIDQTDKPRRYGGKKLTQDEHYQRVRRDESEWRTHGRRGGWRGGDYFEWQNPEGYDYDEAWDRYLNLEGG